MGIDFLVNLANYKSTENITPEENFCTEVLAFILKFSRDKRTLFFGEFMEKLSRKVAIDDYPEYRIGTQKVFQVGKKTVRPDLCIENFEQLYLIEAKVDSGINYYQQDNNAGEKEIINQVKLYESIETQKSISIALLIKKPLYLMAGDCLHGVPVLRWHDIFDLMKESKTKNPVEKFFFNDFMRYMEVKFMTIGRVGYDLKNGMDSIFNLMNQLEEALEGIKYRASAGSLFLGYLLYLEEMDKKNSVWVGIDINERRFAFQIVGPAAKQYIEKTRAQGYKEYAEGYGVFFNFDDHYFCLDANEQVQKIREWIREHYSSYKTYLEEERNT